MNIPVPAAARLVVALVLLVGVRSDLSSQSSQSGSTTGAIQREYTLEATMVGYRGVGGEIDGVRNPTLWARTGESVRITLVNGELMVHDIALEKLDVRSQQILDKGATTSITFKAEESDTYYCSLPGHRLAGMEGRLDVSEEPRVKSEGVEPAANGRALNLDFESGTLEPWTATGDAFQVVKDDASAAKKAGQAGTYWVSSSPGGSARKGTLSSAPFRVTHPYASFLVSGGAFTSTRVEVALAEDKTVIYSISGAEQATLRPAVVDLRSHAGKEIVIRLVDEETGASTATYIKENPWAHLNFDHFRFHESKPFFPNEVTPADITTLPPMDPVMHAGLSGADAVRALRVPKDFSV